MVRKTSILSLLGALAFAGVPLAQASPCPTGGLVADVNMNGIVGSFKFVPPEGSTTGVTVTVDITSGLTDSFAILPNVGFEYHIHVNPVGPNGDCMATGGHLDPTNVGMAIKCSRSTPAKCQEGDLSGKHGNLTPTESGAITKFTYTDSQLAFGGDAATTIVGRSVVIHNNGTRVACADLLPLQEDDKSCKSISSQEAETKASASLMNSQSNAGAGEMRVSRETAWTIVGTLLSSAMVAGMMAF